MEREREKKVESNGRQPSHKNRRESHPMKVYKCTITTSPKEMRFMLTMATITLSPNGDGRKVEARD